MVRDLAYGIRNILNRNLGLALTVLHGVTDSTSIQNFIVSIYIMAAVAAEIPDEFGPGPMEGLVLRFIKEHRSCAIWEGKDPGELTCRGRNDEFQKRLPMVDDRVLDIVKRVGLEGLHRTPSREIDHNLITAFVERWRPKTHTFHLPHGETTITLQDVEVLLGIPIDGEAMVGTT
ncbi:hypothetical protein SO802_022366 [Lithocarpus litseifolius]|uniref:Aminotransferase-like plant mobile domain-containing protein n=1 Tax=Lithocarpus litseifolius TaxID=425828 RepID=A0AAW2CMC0_9ROSI